MTNSSRIKLAKELLYCARMVLDASCHKEAQKIVASNSYYNKIKEYIIEQKPYLLEAIKRYGVDSLKGNKYVLHHFGNTSHFISTNKSNNWYKRILQVLNNQKLIKYVEKNYSNIPLIINERNINKLNNSELLKALQDEMEHIVFIPEWYHNLIHSHGGKDNSDSPEQIFRNMELLLTDSNFYESTDKLKFDDSNINTAIKSIENLASVSNSNNKSQIIELLRELYVKMKLKIIDDLSHH